MIKLTIAVFVKISNLVDISFIKRGNTPLFIKKIYAKFEILLSFCRL